MKTVPEDADRFFELYERMIGDDVDLPSVLTHVADVVRREVNAERSTVYLINHDTGELQSAAVIGNISQSIRIPINKKSLAGYCALTRSSFIVPDAYGDLSTLDAELCFDKSWDRLNRFRTRDVMCTPVLFKNHISGVVQAVNSLKHHFRQADVERLKSIARLIGYALYHSTLYNDLATLKQLDKEKAEFMRIMVHELKSPVAAAQSLIDLVTRGYIDQPESLIAHHKKISSRLEQMQVLIQDILSLAAIKQGGPLGDITVLDLAAEAAAGAAPHRDQARGKGLELTLELPPDPLPVRFDSQGLRLVLSNLIANAVKYTLQGSVSVRVYREDRWAVLAVSDTGIGIPQQDIPRLFREFFRASNAKRARIQGSGVGLAGVKNIIERFGGELLLESVENRGSTFTARLPYYAE